MKTEYDTSPAALLERADRFNEQAALLLSLFDYVRPPVTSDVNAAQIKFISAVLQAAEAVAGNLQESAAVLRAIAAQEQDDDL